LIGWVAIDHPILRDDVRGWSIAKKEIKPLIDADFRKKLMPPLRLPLMPTLRLY